MARKQSKKNALKKATKSASAKKPARKAIKPASKPKTLTKPKARDFSFGLHSTSVHLPDYAQNLLSAAQGVPWDKATPQPACNGYFGIMRDSFFVFHELNGMPNGVQTAVYYESKLSNDSDGAGSPPFPDPDRDHDTSLHLAGSNTALDPMVDSYAVLPLDADETDTPKHGLPDLDDGLGLRLGDIGVVFWRAGSSGPVKRRFFIYGDKGPAVKLGEASTKVCIELGIDPHVVGSGLEKSEMDAAGKGVIHIAFPGSGRAFIEPGSGKPKTRLMAADVITEGTRLLNQFMNQ